MKLKYISIGLIVLTASCQQEGWNGDVYIPPSEVEYVYTMPDISSTLGLFTDDVNIGIGIELLDKHNTALDLQFFEHKIGLSLSYRWTSVLEVKTGVIGIYDFNKDKWRPGIALSISR